MNNTLNFQQDASVKEPWFYAKYKKLTFIVFECMSCWTAQIMDSEYFEELILNESEFDSKESAISFLKERFPKMK